MSQFMSRIHGARWCFEAEDEEAAVAKAIAVNGAAPDAANPLYRGQWPDPEPPVYTLLADPLKRGRLIPVPVNRQAHARGSERAFTIGEL